MRPTTREIAIICGFSLFIYFDQFVGYDFFSHRRVLPRPETQDSPSPVQAYPITSNPSTVLGDTSPRLVWDDSEVPETRFLTKEPAGWTTMDRLYMLNGTLYVVTDDPDIVPERRLMLSAGLAMSIDPVEAAANEPTDEHLQVISRKEAKELFGNFASRIDGVTFLDNDPPQFLVHYFHFVVEMLALGFWRVYSSLDPSITASGTTSLEFPRHLIFPHAAAEKWFDPPGVNQFVVRAAFPSIAIETSEEWELRSALERPFVFDRVVIGDRAATHRAPPIKYPDVEFPLNLSEHWWEPIRKEVVAFATGNVNGTDEPRPVITYVSRQKTGRRLRDKDHENLVKALKKLNADYGYEVYMPQMENMSKIDQIRLASRTTILLGVHGNGLSAQLWMPPGPRSTVIEIYYPPGFAYDYQYTARSLGLRHYGIWDSEHFTYPDLPELNVPEGFHGSDIPVNGDAVAKLIHEILSESH